VEKGNFYISETEYIAPATLHDEGKPASQIIQSDLKQLCRSRRWIIRTNVAMGDEIKKHAVSDGNGDCILTLFYRS
jgi:hypothetical protein